MINREYYNPEELAEASLIKKIQKRREYRRAYWQKNKERIKRQNKEYKIKNQDKVKKYTSEYNSREDVKTRNANWIKSDYKSNPKKYKDRYKKYTDNVYDSYIKSLLKSFGVPKSQIELHPEIIELYQLQLISKRKLKQAI